MSGSTRIVEHHEDVSDSTDWLGTPLAPLAQVEAALRCQVCKNFFQTPMMTSCSHTFCSLCIRRCLSNDGKCPACRAPEQELKLRNNGSVEDVVEAFKRARDSALNFARTPIDSVLDSAPHVKRTLSDAEMLREEPNGKRLRSSARIAGMATEPRDIEVIDSSPEPERLPEGMVTCPICTATVKMESINSHIDARHSGNSPTNAASPTQKPAGWPPENRAQTASSRPHPLAVKPKPLPTLSYALLKESALRKKLTELGLSAAGSRSTLERRHTEWLNLWNANCDASWPRGKRELLQELDVWERTQGSRAPASSGNGNATLGGGGGGGGSQISRKDFDGAAWAARHDRSFQDLIAAARKSAPKKTPDTPTHPEAGDREATGDVQVEANTHEKKEEDIPIRVSLPDDVITAVVQNPVENGFEYSGG